MRRRLAQDAARPSSAVSVQDLARFAETFADLADPDVMSQAWRRAPAIHKSALVHLTASPDAAEWAGRVERGLVRIATVTRLEVGYSARSGPELRSGLRQPPMSSMPVEYLTPAIEERAVEILALLADRGQHRVLRPYLT